MTTRNAQEKLELFQRFFQKFPEFLGDSDTARKRRTAILPHLNAGFKVTRGKMESVLQGAKAVIGKPVPRTTISGTDSPAIRVAADYLNGKPYKQSSPIAKGLKEADIKDWGDLEKKLSEAGSEEPTADETPTAAREPQRETLLSGAAISPESRFSSLLKVSLSAQNAIIAIFEDQERQIKDLQQRVDLLRSELARSGEKIDELESLRRQQIFIGLETAAKDANFPDLQRIAQELNAEAEQKRREKMDIPPEFPTYSKAENRAVRYEDKFLIEYNGPRVLSGEREQVIKALQSLCDKGWQHSSLYSRKYKHPIVNLPAGCFSSRAGQEWRIFWSRDNGTIIIHDLVNKGDTRLKQSEA